MQSFQSSFNDGVLGLLGVGCDLLKKKIVSTQTDGLGRRETVEKFMGGSVVDP